MQPCVGIRFHWLFLLHYLLYSWHFQFNPTIKVSPKRKSCFLNCAGARWQPFIIHSGNESDYPAMTHLSYEGVAQQLDKYNLTRPNWTKLCSVWKNMTTRVSYMIQTTCNNCRAQVGYSARKFTDGSWFRLPLGSAWNGEHNWRAIEVFSVVTPCLLNGKTMLWPSTSLIIKKIYCE